MGLDGVPKLAEVHRTRDGGVYHQQLSLLICPPYSSLRSKTHTAHATGEVCECCVSQGPSHEARAVAPLPLLTTCRAVRRASPG